ncbi:DUF4435 domain-containing protein [Rhabdobacter roseus]|uniref:DUF4435 domain-containing protein n=1 Tax=Rhabdobacter roseus TaxID=1655419 RepID=A0A840TTU6_9BACT|nr:DUF4435 domain-containing protein [Rhabdobacter roseus]MBB5286325.1 hypothetical protein [Rhabdobacter roseus]
MKIKLPTKKGIPNTNPEIDFEQLVIIGANGSGKTRFGAKIEEDNHLKTHRISAQKSLSIPKLVRPTSLEVARNEFFIGSNHPQQNVNEALSYKKSNRWGDNFNTHLLNDYEKLLVLLHTEEYETLSDSKEKNILSPITKIDTVKSIWEKVLPHRKLKIKSGVIETYPTGQEDNKYNASEMSDGERVIFYLIGEVICSPEKSMIIIDEPEMHIHKSLVKTLFDLIEIERPDCSFIYLTHDIDFAFTRQNAAKIWAKAYEGNSIWDYEILEGDMPIPEQLYLEVLGSRKPVIFLEGDNSSIDYEIYEHVFPTYTLKPLGSCEKVIQSVKSFNEQKGFHHIDSFGIIDRDRRQVDDIVKLNSKGVWVLDVAEAENLLLIEDIVKAVASHMGRDANDVFDQVKRNLISFFSDQMEAQILLHFKESLRKKFLSLTNFTKKNLDDVLPELNTMYQSIDKQNLFENIKLDFEKAASTQNYDSILQLFNLKNALIPASKVCDLTGIRNKEEYKRLVITILKRKDIVSEQISKGIDLKIIKTLHNNS